MGYSASRIKGHEGVARVALLSNARGAISHRTRAFIVLTVLEHGHIREETIFYADSIYERILIVSFTLGNHVVILFWMSP